MGDLALTSVECTDVESRSYPRFAVRLSGLCSIAGGPDVVCSTTNISLAGVALRYTGPANIGDPIIVLLPQIGMLNGTIVRLFDEGLAVGFTSGQVQTSKISGYLVWMLTRNEDPSIEERDFERIVPLCRIVTIGRADGSMSVARILDASRSGIACTTTKAFSVGEAIRVGSRGAIVVRVLEQCVIARFDEILDAGFDATIRF